MVVVAGITSCSNGHSKASISDSRMSGANVRVTSSPRPGDPDYSLTVGIHLCGYPQSEVSSASLVPAKADPEITLLPFRLADGHFVLINEATSGQVAAALGWRWQLNCDSKIQGHYTQREWDHALSLP